MWNQRDDMMACQNKQCLTFAKIKRADREKVCSKTNMITLKKRKKRKKYIIYKFCINSHFRTNNNNNNIGIISISTFYILFKLLVRIYIPWCMYVWIVVFPNANNTIRTLWENICFGQLASSALKEWGKNIVCCSIIILSKW